MLENEKDEPAGAPAEEDLNGAIERAGAPTQSHLMPTQQGPPVRPVALTQDIGLAAMEASGRYINPTEYGRGGMGRVLLVHDTFLSRDVALKELIAETDSADQTVVGNETAAESAHFLQRFLREARITGNLEHPSIVPVYELGRRPGGGHYYTMKLVRGRTLHRAIRDARNLKERLKLLPHVIDLCNAIAYAHSKGVIHRDIKPSNVMVGSYGETVVIDWGLARVLDQDDPYAATLDVPLSGNASDSPDRTMAGIPVGTPQYMSPEQAAGKLDEVGIHSDVYALGVVLYEVLAGRTPFTGTRSRDVLRQVLNTKPAPVTSHEPNVPPDLARICATAMERRPGDRFGSAAELAEELVRFSTGALVKSYDYNFLELAKHYYRQNKALCNSVLASAAVVLLVVVVAYANILAANQRERLQRQAAEAEAYRANIQVVANEVRDQNFESARQRLLLQPPEQRDWEWGYLFAQCHEDYATGEGHEERVYRLHGAPKSGRLISIGEDNRVIVWSTPDLEKLHEFRFSETPGVSVDLSADERLLVLSQMGQPVRLYDFAAFELLQTFEFDGLHLERAALSGDGNRIAFGSQDGTMVVLDIGSNEEIRRFDSTQQGRHVLAMNHSGTTVLTMEGRNQYVLYDIYQGTPLVTVEDARPRIPGNRSFFCVSNPQQAGLFNMDTGERVFSAQRIDAPIDYATHSDDGRRVATVEDKDTAHIWNTENGKKLATYDLPPHRRILGLDNSGTRLALSTLPNSVEIRNLETGTIESQFLGHSAPVDAGVFSPDGEFYFTGAGDAYLKSWKHQLVLPEDGQSRDERITDLAWSEEAGLIGVGVLDGTVHFLDDESLSNVLTITSREPNTYTRIAFRPDGTRAAVLLNPSMLFEINLPDGEIVNRYPSTSAMIRTFDYSPSDDALAIGYDDTTIRVWDSGPTSEPLIFTEHTSDVTTLEFHSNLLISGDRTGTVCIWDWRTGRVLNTVYFPGESIEALATSPTDGLFACAVSNNTIRVFRTAGGTPVYSLADHGNIASDLEFSPSGNRLFSATRHGKIKIWNIETGQDLLAQHDDNLHGASIAFVNAELVAGDSAKTLAIHQSFAESEYTQGSITIDVLERFKNYRRNQSKDHRISAHTTRQIAIVSKTTIEEAVERISAFPQITPTNQDPSGYVEPNWNPLAGFSIQAGDRLLETNKAPIAGTADLQAQLLSVLASNTPKPVELTLQVDRAGSPVKILCRTIPLEIQEAEFPFTHDSALALLNGTLRRLRDVRSVLLEHNHRRSSEDGARLYRENALDGLWIPSPGTLEDADTLRAFGLKQDDRIVSVNGKRITDYNALQSDLEGAANALEQGWTGTIEVLVERSSLQQLTLKLTVQDNGTPVQ